MIQTAQRPDLVEPIAPEAQTFNARLEQLLAVGRAANAAQYAFLKAQIES